MIDLIYLWKWLSSKDKWKCPKCNYPIIWNKRKKTNECPNCKANWWFVK